MTLEEGRTSSSLNIPKPSHANRLTLRNVLDLLEVDELPEGLYSPEEIVAMAQEMIDEHEDGIKWFRENRKLHLAQLEQLQTF